jgi:hypothetical protein
MEPDPIPAFLKEAQKKLNEVTTARADLDKNYAKKRADIDALILKWKRAIDGVMAIAESEQSDPADIEVSAFVDGKAGRQTIKFTDAVRLCLKQRGDKPASAPDVRDRLINLGFDFGKYTQPLVPIHNCLKRLADQGEAEAVKNSDGQIVGYKWISPIEQAVAEEYPANFYDVLGSGVSVLDANRMAEMRRLLVQAEVGTREQAARMLEQAAKIDIGAIQQFTQQFAKKPPKKG